MDLERRHNSIVPLISRLDRLDFIVSHRLEHPFMEKPFSSLLLCCLALSLMDVACLTDEAVGEQARFDEMGQQELGDYAIRLGRGRGLLQRFADRSGHLSRTPSPSGIRYHVEKSDRLPSLLPRLNNCPSCL